jgi:5-formyltetrahydrofolate cyclo-ligase
MIFVPSVAFDHHRNRIGRGGGYYDKFLRRHPRAFQVGVCYDYQLKNKTIPHNLLDRKVDRIITPSRKISH